jgi:hypothetical protein
MVTSYGMSEVLGPLAYQKQQNQFLGGMEMARNVSPATSEAIDKEIKTIVENAHASALAILNENRGLLESISEKLLETEVIEGDVLTSLLDQVKAATVACNCDRNSLPKSAIKESHCGDHGDFFVMMIWLDGDRFTIICLCDQCEPPTKE